MIRKERMCIYVSSPQSYRDVLDVFMLCKKKFWGACPYNTVISTNYNLINPEVYVINSEIADDSWVDRSLNALRQIDYEYVMLLCDDMFISKQIDTQKIEKILDYMDLNEINFCRLNPLRFGEHIKELPFISIVNRNIPYGINLQRGIFRREYLINLLGDGSKSAWDIEGSLLEQAKNADDVPFGDVIACNTNIFPVIHGVEKGKWFPSSIKKLSKLGIEIEGNREKISIPTEFRQNIITYLSSHISPQNRKRMKRMAQKVGYRFISNN